MKFLYSIPIIAILCVVLQLILYTPIQLETLDSHQLTALKQVIFSKDDSKPQITWVKVSSEHNAKRAFKIFSDMYHLKYTHITSPNNIPSYSELNIISVSANVFRSYADQF